jgi:hypothetical protein
MPGLPTGRTDHRRRSPGYHQQHPLNPQGNGHAMALDKNDSYTYGQFLQYF